MTPERIKELLDDLAHWTNDAVLDEPVEAEEWDDAAPLTRRELRALLATVGKTCEWVLTTVKSGHGQDTQYHGHSGLGMGYAPRKYCPECGGRVVVRDGRT